MPPSQKLGPKAPLLIVSGAKGAVGSTVAATAAALKRAPESVLPYLTAPQGSAATEALLKTQIAGWDLSARTLEQSLEYHGVLPPEKFLPLEEDLREVSIRQAPPPAFSFREQVERLIQDIREFKRLHPENQPVFINLLPACELPESSAYQDLEHLYARGNPSAFPDLAYTLAAILSGLPVVNFTPNPVELPLLVQEAVKAGTPLCGRDGKTGQTYLKVVLASALRARSLRVDGWYSLNLLGNEDGRNLVDPRKAAGKLANKTEVLDEILGYSVGDRYGVSSHKVVIDYYPPRGDAKEAWDVIDFAGLFGLPMSLRLNLQARDSILAAPLVIDLAWWMVSLQAAGRSGLVPELGFYFKKPLGPNPPITFQDQLAQLDRLRNFCREKTGG
jgi:myo-inositol-1-phosphate synthase